MLNFTAFPSLWNNRYSCRNLKQEYKTEMLLGLKKKLINIYIDLQVWINGIHTSVISENFVLSKRAITLKKSKKRNTKFRKGEKMKYQTQRQLNTPNTHTHSLSL